jgi:uncharacterized protein
VPFSQKTPASKEPTEPKKPTASKETPEPQKPISRQPEASTENPESQKPSGQISNGLENRLSPEAINAWRISGSMGSLVYWIIPLVYGAVSMGSDTLPEWPSYVLGVFFLLYTILEATVIPYIRWKRWSYRVDRHEIDLQRGLFVITRTLIPVKRVQHVDTRQGPVYRQFGLASVTITTAGDVHEIPALSEPVADDLRHKISEYARVAREDL